MNQFLPVYAQSRRDRTEPNIHRITSLCGGADRGKRMRCNIVHHGYNTKNKNPSVNGQPVTMETTVLIIGNGCAAIWFI